MNASVYYFGGYQASQANVNLWKSTAHAQMGGLDFYVFPYPDADWIGENAVAAFKKGKNSQFDQTVAAIKADKAEKIYIVGHSSGCAVANEVDRGLKYTDKEYQRIVLVALDGYRPDDNQLGRKNTQVWIAKSGDEKNLHKSYHYKDLHPIATDIYDARTDCTRPVALHFSLVNSKSNDTDVGDSIPKGYTNCQANLCWVK